MNDLNDNFNAKFYRICMRILPKSEKIRQNLDAVAAAEYFTYVTAMTYFSISDMRLSLAGMMLTVGYFLSPIRNTGILLTGQ